MKHLSNEKLNALRKAVAHYLDLLDDDNNKDEQEYNLLEKLYDELINLTFNK